MKTALYEAHKALGAKLVDFAGWEMPIQYENLKKEVQAVRENVGVFDVSHMGEFFVEGSEALDFVDYLVTNDIKNSEISKAIYSPLCREDGTIIDDLIVYKISHDKLMICVNAANIQKDFKWMQEHIEKFNCTLTNKSEDYSLLALQGPKSFEILKSIDMGFEVKDMDYYSIQTGPKNILIARTGYTGEDGFEIFGDHTTIKMIWTRLMELNVTPCGLGARDVLRLEVCYPLYGQELNDDLTPLDAGLKWTVKFDKEDFIGKQFLMNYYPKYQLLKIILDKGIPRIGYAVENASGKKIGEITSGTMSVVISKGVALARVEKILYSNEEKLSIDIRGRKYSAQINKKPFVAGGHK
jgi:aminomethyltransferase